ncbi:iron complex outermembrane receptor protein [Sphingomonas vulcanisoli]|uniref:Iron complex outermembrane receptor protein n=1 Tax=Sphingomonas vulcanisoli TaxID=1658060 RepID=A0ABX0TML5_9SPHN|nr:TonB-dependent receptor [Sphingomonas vulcanisoli]NIJ06758.1 iron complex outermembrane receptor protein [Sphingomonas vulcanisoli]
MHSAFLKTSTALLAITVGTMAHGQTAAPVPAAVAPAAEMPTQGLADIVVTAQRRTESAQHAAIAIDVVSPAELTGKGVMTASTLNAVAPALTVQQGGGANTTFFIRGVGNYTNNAYSDPAIAFNLDGVYLGRPTSTTGTFFDLQRIEVLKGPQGTLYGRNATGGAINIIPNKPVLGERSLNVALGAGNYNAINAEVAANVPLSDIAALRVAATSVYHTGYYKDGTGDENGKAARVQLLVKPDNRISLRLSGDYSHQGGVGSGASYIGTENYTPGSPSTAKSPANYTFTPANLDPYSGLLSPASRAYFSGQVIPGAFVNPAPLSRPYLDNNYYGVTGEASLETGLGTLTVIPAYRRSDLDFVFNGPSFRSSHNVEKDQQFSTEARLQGKRIGPVDWLVGGYYFDETVRGQYAINQYQIISFQNFTSKTKSYAGFGRLTLHLSDRLRLVGGGRYTKDDKTFNANVSTLVEACARPTCFGGPSLPVVDTLAQFVGGPTIPGVPVPYGTSGNIALFIPNTVVSSIDKGRFTYRVAGEFDLAPRSLLYASYETGYRSGGFSVAPGHEMFKPEYVDAWTLGSKNRFFDNRVQLNIEAFYWKYRDQQVSHFGIDANNSVNFFTENVGRSTLKGVDIDAQFLVTPTTQLSGTVQYLDSRVTSYQYNTPKAALEPVVGCPFSTPSAASPIYVVNCSGKRAYNSPKWSVNAGVEQTIPLDDYKVVVSGSLQYRSNTVIGFDYLPQQNTGGNTTYDASLSFGDAKDRWTVTGFIRNLTNRAVPTYAQFVGSVGNQITSTYAPPRTYGARAAFKF